MPGRLLKRSSINIVRIQDVGLSGENDPAILEWAARENRIQGAKTHLWEDWIFPKKLKGILKRTLIFAQFL